MTSELAKQVVGALHGAIANLGAQRDRPLRELWRAALAVEHIVLSDLLTEEQAETVLEEMSAASRQTCQEIFCDLETRIEESFAALAFSAGREVILHRDSITEGYLCRYQELARREVDLAGITKQDRVLFIGSGPFPITAIEYHRQTGCAVECVDCLPEAAATSRWVIERLKLGGGIHCREARGENVPASDFSVVLAGVLARPKQPIFENLQATCPSGCRIVARTTWGLRRLIYCPTDLDTTRLDRLRPSGSSVAKGDQVLSSVLYRVL